MQNGLPVPDVLPLPSPPWIFLVLSFVTLAVHLIFMNFIFGGSILAGISYFKGKKDSNHMLLAQKLYKFMPAAVAVAVNFGIAPLLFVQALYGHLLYSSSILMAVGWISVIPCIILAYYGTYTLRFKWDKTDALKPVLTIVIPLIFAWIAFMLVNNFSMMLRPETWYEHYFKDPAYGTLNWTDASLLPRYLHMALGALAVASLWVMVIGARKKTGNAEWSNWAARYGGTLFLMVTMVNIVIGLWFLISHKKDIMMNFMGKNLFSTIILAAAVIFALFILIFVNRIRKDPARFSLALPGFGMIAFLLILMIINRHNLRQAYLSEVFHMDKLQVEPQWGTFLIFLGIFVFILIPSLYWLIKISATMKPLVPEKPAE